MKITNMAYEIFRRAAHRWSLDTNVSLERIEHYGQDEILELGINWSCCGTQSVNHTHFFVDYLRVAAAVAEEINRYQFEVVPGNEPDINSIEAWTSETQKIYEMFHVGRIGQIGRWFEDRRIA